MKDISIMSKWVQERMVWSKKLNNHFRWWSLKLDSRVLFLLQHYILWIHSVGTFDLTSVLELDHNKFHLLRRNNIQWGGGGRNRAYRWFDFQKCLVPLGFIDFDRRAACVQHLWKIRSQFRWPNLKYPRFQTLCLVITP